MHKILYKDRFYGNYDNKIDFYLKMHDIFKNAQASGLYFKEKTLKLFECNLRFHQIIDFIVVACKGNPKSTTPETPAFMEEYIMWRIASFYCLGI